MNNIRGNHNIVKDVGFTLLSEGKTIRIKAHGYSMYPCIKPGSLILIEPIHIKGMPVPGEIIAIKRENGLIVHRLTKIIIRDGVKSFIARGDSNAYDDNPVSSDKIAGRIAGAEATGENSVPADIRINTRPNYFYNRLRVIWILIWKKIRK
ncbi:MAG: ATP-binding cassette, subfamily bacterial [Bacteroidota bacterium]|nr:ATP-binding cassette, subfamily bacterial [Bacteroidota bacterium]